MLLILFESSSLMAQSAYQPYSYQFYQKFSDDLYSTGTRIHSSIKPFFIDDSLLKPTYDSLISFKSAGKKLFSGHLIDTKAKNYTLYADLLPDLLIGRDFSGRQTTSLTTLGAQVGGTIGTNFFFYGSFYDNEARFPVYFNNIINSTGFVPGQGQDGNPGQLVKDYYYSSFLISYTPVKFINFSLGKDKTFIGDGYWSMLLSDFASNYPFLKLTATVGNVKYMAMYAYLNNPNAPLATNGDQRNKWAYFQYLDWNVSNRISIGFFQNVMEANESTSGQKRGFNVSLASPFVFLVPENNIDNDPGKNLLGVTAKYKILDKTIIYGQFALNEFHSKDFFSGNGSVTNKSGYQIGFRGAGLLGIKGFNYLAEFNTARPFTYSSFDQTSNYSQDDQPLAHPFGANFREWLTILDYSIGRVDLQGQVNYAYYGLDPNGLDDGQNIFEPYTNAASQYGNFVGQGLRTNFYYAEGKIAYVINPKYNLRFEVSGIYRNEKNSLLNSKTSMLTIGLRSSFRNIYNDF